ncbi:hypothetical protein FM036_40490 [Nostoc sp. HG1]|nr:hypothetical protein [Nostoc sp. HG1]
MNQWQAAIALMKNVPSSSSNYVVAQPKNHMNIQKNLNYAEKKCRRWQVMRSHLKVKLEKAVRIALILTHAHKM